MPNHLPRVLLLAAVLLPGCASQLSELKRANHTLSDQVTTLRAHARTDQATIRDQQNQIFVLKDQLETSQVGAGKTPGAVPKLPVEVLAPSAKEDDPPAGDSDLSDLGPGARVVGISDDGTEIVYADDAAAGKAAPPPEPDPDPSGGGAIDAPRPRANHTPASLAPVPATSDRLAALREVPKVSAVAARTSAPAPRPDRGDHADPRDPRADYQAAVDALHAGDHAAAISGLREFLRRYPDHDYADNAQYWLGEAYYDQKDYKRGLEEFRKTVERYPHGNKVPDAMLKVGYCYAALGQTTEARATLEELVSVYPRSRSAQLATTRLDTLGK